MFPYINAAYGKWPDLTMVQCFQWRVLFALLSSGFREETKVTVVAS